MTAATFLLLQALSEQADTPTRISCSPSAALGRLLSAFSGSGDTRVDTLAAGGGG